MRSREGLETGTMTVDFLVARHLGGGMLILGIVTLQIVSGAPPEGTPPPHRGRTALGRPLAARATHLSFYGVLFLLPVTGAVAWGAGLGSGGRCPRSGLRAVLLVLILAHVGAVLVHRFRLGRRPSQPDGASSLERKVSTAATIRAASGIEPVGDQPRDARRNFAVGKSGAGPVRGGPPRT